MMILQTMKRMKRKSGVWTIAAALVLMMLAAGCGGNDEKPVPVDLSSENKQDSREELTQNTGEDNAAEGQPEDIGDEEPAKDQSEDTGDEEPAEGRSEDIGDEESVKDSAKTSGSEELAGSVRSVEKDSFVINKITTYSEGDAEIAVETAPGTEGEELITVYVKEDCTYRYMTVRNSGINPEDISEREGSFTDMKEGLTVGMMGSWKDGAFYADSMVMREVIH